MTNLGAIEPVRSIRMFLVDDHEVVRRGIADLFKSAPGFEIVGEAARADEARRRILATRPDVVVMDARLPDGSGIDVCRDVRAALPSTYCLVLTSYDDRDAMVAAARAGASGYLLKEVRGASIVDAVREVADGRSLLDPAVIAAMAHDLGDDVVTVSRTAMLTERERQVLDLVADGLTNREIGERLYLSDKTVKNYVSRLLTKLGMARRSQVAVFGAEQRRS